MCDGVCRTVGEGHYITFDGLKYSFPGLCQYVLVQVRVRDVRKDSGIESTVVSKQQKTIAFPFSAALCPSPFSLLLYVQDMCNGEEGSFRVMVENEACGIVGHRCAKAVTVFYKGGLITMQHGEVTHKHTNNTHTHKQK